MSFKSDSFIANINQNMKLLRTKYEFTHADEKEGSPKMAKTSKNYQKYNRYNGSVSSLKK